MAWRRIGGQAIIWTNAEPDILTHICGHYGGNEIKAQGKNSLASTGKMGLFAGEVFLYES